MNINDFIVAPVPDTIMYIPNFISHDDEKEILNKVYSAPKPKWTQLRDRRLQNWGGIPHVNGMIPEPIPEWLRNCMKRIDDLKVFDENSPNHVLINEYKPGQGIMPHTDGPLFHPVVSTISCGSHTVLNLQCSNDDENKGDDKAESKREIFSLLLEPRSLLILKDNAYKNYLHGINEIVEDTVIEKVCNLHKCAGVYNIGEKLQRTTRVSLTIRNVPKCFKGKLRF